MLNKDILFGDCIHILTIISSESCNLNCKYCEIAKTTSPYHFLENEKIKKAMEDKTYIENIKKVFFRFSMNFKEIKKIELWGEEPTLTLDSFSIMFNDLYSTFPNLEAMFFSTNGIQYSNRIINFIKNADSILNKEFLLNIQISYDGYWGTLNSRGINPDQIKTNITNLCNELNKIDLKFLKVNIAFHNVVDLELINYINTQQNGVYNFLKELDDFRLYFKNININKRVTIGEFSEGFINPYNASKEEGKNYSNFHKQCIYLCKTNDFKIRLGTDFFLKHSKEIISNQKYNDYDKDIEETIYSLIGSRKECSSINYPGSHGGCSPSYTHLRIRYDGKLVHCHEIIFGLTEQDILTCSDIQKQNVRKEMLRFNYAPNLIIDSDEDINRWIKRWKYIFNIDSLPLFFTINVNLMTILSNLNQIDESYKTDRMKLLRHALILAQFYICWENNLSINGTLYGECLGRIRFYANGLLDDIEQRLKENYNKEIKN